ncbi:hypothetical protein KIN20_002379 [Parelaphostrongylus tenuis]|uniref:Mos1 transposase HTH domain-containing protein n=1 Tax=Parelaphostrongylus tenuis TaxID=148309 RepID=A0AAD5LZQ1_PARTN|nr:hypothetical protein KIN20_002379 [Parelaphostrongylus tenuis]
MNARLLVHQTVYHLPTQPSKWKFKEGNHLLLHFHNQLGVIIFEAHLKICKAYGDEIQDVRAVQRWLKTFCEEGDRLADEPREARP